jgi:hypothetical protein
MKRIIIKAPENITMGSLTVEQQTAIRAVFAQFVLPMPGTKSNNSYILIDAVVKDNFDPEHIAALGLPFEIFGLWQWDGINALSELHALDSTFINYLPDTHTYDTETFNILTTTAPVLHEPHRWSGWPAINL